jgi:hypothetical protein
MGESYIDRTKGEIFPTHAQYNKPHNKQAKTKQSFKISLTNWK